MHGQNLGSLMKAGPVWSSKNIYCDKMWGKPSNIQTKQRPNMGIFKILRRGRRRKMERTKSEKKNREEKKEGGNGRRSNFLFTVIMRVSARMGGVISWQDERFYPPRRPSHLRPKWCHTGTLPHCIVGCQPLSHRAVVEDGALPLAAVTSRVAMRGEVIWIPFLWAFDQLNQRKCRPI